MPERVLVDRPVNVDVEAMEEKLKEFVKYELDRREKIKKTTKKPSKICKTRNTSPMQKGTIEKISKTKKTKSELGKD